MTKFSKKLFAISLVIMMVVALFSGCSGEKKDPLPVYDATYTIGFCIYNENDSLSTLYEGFKQGLQDANKDNKYGFDISFQSAEGDSDNCKTIANQFVKDKAQLILAGDNVSLKACADSTKDIPIVGAGISSFPEILGLDIEYNAATGTNVTGVLYDESTYDQVDQIKTFFPERSVGVIYCTSQLGVQSQVDALISAFGEEGVKAESFPFDNEDDLVSATEKASSTYDIVYIPNDNVIAANAGTVSDICEKNETPIICATANMCAACNGVASMSIDMLAVGYAAGQMAYDILVNGADPSTMAIKEPTEYGCWYNPNVAEKYNVLDIIEADGVYAALDAE